MMLPSLQDRVFEVHPEVSLCALHGSPMKESKKSKPGRSARIHALERAWRCKLGEIIETHRCSTVARDDIVDAMAACWTAERVHAGDGDAAACGTTEGLQRTPNGDRAIAMPLWVVFISGSRRYARRSTTRALDSEVDAARRERELSPCGR